MRKPIHVIGVAGGSGSGKTTFSNRLIDWLGQENCALLGQDSYYIDQSHRFDRDGGSVNFDHPESLDFDLMGQHLEGLSLGQAVEVPVYDFKTHKRLQETQALESRPFIIADGILILSQPQVRKHFSISVFLDIGETIRYERRLRRDVAERGRTPEGVKAQFEAQVKPMHDQFVQPSKAYASDLIFDNQSFDEKLGALGQAMLDLLRG